MADPLRDKIAAIVEKHTVLGAPMETADAILAIVRAFATSDAAVEAAARRVAVATENVRNADHGRAIGGVWVNRTDMHAAAAVLGGIFDAEGDQQKVRFPAILENFPCAPKT